MTDLAELTLQEAYEKWADELVRFATVLVGPADAPDVVSDAFVGLLDDEPAWARVERPWSYLIGAVANRAKMRHRTTGRRRHREQRYEASTSTSGADGEIVVEVMTNSNDALRLLDGLSAQQRAVVYLAYWEDWTAVDIAEHLGVSDGTVGLGDDDWVVPAMLPDGFDGVVALGGQDSVDRLLVVGDDVGEVSVVVRDGADVPDDARPVAVGGIGWSVRDYVADDGTLVGYELRRSVGDRTVILESVGSGVADADWDAIVAVAESLTVVPESDLGVPVLDSDAEHIAVAQSDEVTLMAVAVEGVHCLQIDDGGGGRTGTCGHRTTPSMPFVVALEADRDRPLAVGLAEPDVARVEFTTADGEVIVIGPVDQSGAFDQRFWITDDPTVGYDMEIESATLIYTDGRTTTLEPSHLPGRWLVADK